MTEGMLFWADWIWGGVSALQGLEVQSRSIWCLAGVVQSLFTFFIPSVLSGTGCSKLPSVTAGLWVFLRWCCNIGVNLLLYYVVKIEHVLKLLNAWIRDSAWESAHQYPKTCDCAYALVNRSPVSCGVESYMGKYQDFFRGFGWPG